MRRLMIIIIVLLPVMVFAGNVKKIELKQLAGKWEGVGFFLVPVANTKVEIEGEALFTYNDKTEQLRTSLSGSKFMFSYDDSGYMSINQKTDSVRWEIWDNSGKHAVYFGKRNGNKVFGERLRKKDTYQVIIVQSAADTIEFKLHITEPDGNTYDRAAFNLWRVKK